MFGPHAVYTVEETAMISLANPELLEQHPKLNASSIKKDEAQYKTLFQGLDLTKNFYFSYTYDLSHTLQHNMVRRMKVCRLGTPATAMSCLLHEFSSVSLEMR